MFTHILGVWICNHSDISQLKSFAMTILNGVSFWYSPKYCVLKSFFGSLIFSHFYSFPITISNLSSFWCFITPVWSFRIIALLTQTCATYSYVPITSPGSNFTHIACIKNLRFSLFWYSPKHVRHTQTYNWLGSFSLLLIFPDLRGCIIRNSDIRSSMSDLLHNTNYLVLLHVYSLLFRRVY